MTDEKEKKFVFQADIWKLSVSKSVLSGDTGFSNAGVHYIVTDVL
ncbi:MAG: hypothetical protein PHV39_01520 [Methanomicrobium sp.]|nr:hypothetical protein [Methanomicrobium sp.]